MRGARRVFQPSMLDKLGTSNSGGRWRSGQRPQGPRFMENNRVPLKIIRALLQPQKTAWLEPRKKYYFAYGAGPISRLSGSPNRFACAYPNRTPASDRHRAGFVDRNPMVVNPIQSNLTMNELRFWVGTYHSSEYSCCRCCDMAIAGGTHNMTSAERRKEHKGRTNCTKILREVYEKLRYLKTCALCDRTTNNTKWGVPLCKRTCEEDWKVRPVRGTSFKLLLEEERNAWRERHRSF